MLKIERRTEGVSVRLVLSGRIDGLHLSLLKQAIARETALRDGLSLDLAEVRLLDLDAVRFLVRSQASGIHLIRTPAFVREWMAREDSLANSQDDDA